MQISIPPGDYRVAVKDSGGTVFHKLNPSKTVHVKDGEHQKYLHAESWPRLHPLSVQVPHLFRLPVHLRTQPKRIVDKQVRCSYAHTLLELEIVRQGYTWANGDAERRSGAYGEYGEKKGDSARYSMHKLRLARDFYVFDVSSGRRRYMRKTSEYESLGLFWIELGKFFDWPLEWGGSGARSDGNHFSYSHGGKW